MLREKHTHLKEKIRCPNCDSYLEPVGFNGYKCPNCGKEYEEDDYYYRGPLIIPRWPFNPYPGDNPFDPYRTTYIIK